MKNAFNTVFRQAVLQQVKNRCPEIFPIMALSYTKPTPLYIGSEVIRSQTGVQQGDPLGSLGFALAVDPIIRSLDTPFNEWFLDDGTLAGPAPSVTRNLEQLIPKLSEIGLTLNPSKLLP